MKLLITKIAAITFFSCILFSCNKDYGGNFSFCDSTEYLPKGSMRYPVRIIKISPNTEQQKDYLMIRNFSTEEIDVSGWQIMYKGSMLMKFDELELDTCETKYIENSFPEGFDAEFDTVRLYDSDGFLIQEVSWKSIYPKEIVLPR